MLGLGKWLRKKYMVPHPLSLSDREIKVLINEKYVCPDCGEWEFLEEERGRPSHIGCSNCGSWFDDDSSSIFGFNRVFKNGNIDWRKKDKYVFSSYKNYKSYTWTILKEWYKIEIPFNADRQENKRIMKSLEWCGSEMPSSSLWSIKDLTVYFKKEEDAMAFKLKWL